MFCADRVHTSPTVPDRHFAAVVVDDAQLDPRIGLTAGPQQVRAPDRVVLVELRYGAGGFGQPVHLEELASEAVQPFTSTSSVIGEAP